MIAEVRDYISAAPQLAQSKLAEIRRLIQEAVPEAVEGFSYKMPFYFYKGRLTWFGVHKTHIGLYLRPPIIEEHKKELAMYVTTKSAVHFPLGKDLPTELIKRLVKARARINEEEEMKKRH